MIFFWKLSLKVSHNFQFADEDHIKGTVCGNNGRSDSSWKKWTVGGLRPLLKGVNNIGSYGIPLNFQRIFLKFLIIFPDCHILHQFYIYLQIQGDPFKMSQTSGVAPCKRRF